MALAIIHAPGAYWHRMPPPFAAASAGWIRQCGQRLRLLWAVKMAGTIAGMGGFFAAYFWVLHHPLFPVTVMPRTAADRWIGYQPWAAVPYVTLWVYVALVPALLRNARELRSLGIAWLVLAILGLGIFVAWPSTVSAPAPGEEPWPAFAFLQDIDAAGNACPSLHVAFAVLTAVWLDPLLRAVGAGRWVRAGNWAWCLAIGWSTVAIRQHVALDVAAGAALGAVVGLLHLRTLPRD